MHIYYISKYNINKYAKTNITLIKLNEINHTIYIYI